MKVNVEWNEWNGLMGNGVIGDPNCRMNDDRISIDVWLIVMWNDRNWLESREWMTEWCDEQMIVRWLNMMNGMEWWIWIEWLNMDRMSDNHCQATSISYSLWFH